MASLTDNMIKFASKNMTLTGTTITSDEIELDIPRGYIAKFHKIDLEVLSLSADLADQTADFDAQIAVALVRDPDDQTSLNPPDNDVQHDVLIRMYTDVLLNVTEGSSAIVHPRKSTGWIPQHLDLITARNLRLNADVFGANAASITEASIRCDVFFTYEKVTKGDILELLEII